MLTLKAEGFEVKAARSGMTLPTLQLDGFISEKKACATKSAIEKSKTLLSKKEEMRKKLKRQPPFQVPC